jgi:hypothetical protein
MTSKTVFVGRSRVVEDPTLLMGGVAVHAGRDLVRLLLPEASFDDLYVDLLDAGVALGAGRCYPLRGDAGPGIGVGEDVV